MLEFRSLRIRLGDTADAATVVRAFEREHGTISWADLDLLAAIEDFHRPGAYPEHDEE